MLEGHVIMADNVGAAFGQIDDPAKGKDAPYSTSFEHGGLTVQVLWDGPTLKDFLQRCLDTMEGGTAVRSRRPQLEIVSALPRRGASSNGRPL